jgi:MFS family permease
VVFKLDIYLIYILTGVFGDWFDRKRTIVSLDFLNGIILAVFAAIYIINGSLSVPMIYVLVILLEITEIFFGSAMSAVLPSLVKKEDLMEANSLNSLVMNIGNILSPVIAAFLYSSFGIKVILVINAVSFILSAASEMFINIPKSHGKPEKIDLKSFRKDLMEGINIIKSNKLISTMIGLGTVINFSISPLFSIGLIYITKEVLKVSDMQFGAFQMVLSVSMLLAPMICGGITKKIKIGRLTHLSFIVISILILVMSIFPSSFVLQTFNTNMVSYVGLLIITFIVGLVVTVANIALGTLFDQVVPLDMMGRTSTVFNLAVTVFVPFGQMIFGVLYDKIIPSAAIIISGIILLTITSLYKKALISYDEREQRSEPEAEDRSACEV